MPRIRILAKNFRYDNRTLAAGEEIDMPDTHAIAFTRLGKAEYVEEDSATRRTYRRRDMKAQA